ncbi:MAG: FMN-binding protein [Pseudomonadota bacterium]
MKKRILSVVYMFLLTLVFTSVVSVVKAVNEDRIERNQQVKLQRIVLKVLGVAVRTHATEGEILNTFRNRVKSVEIKGRMLYIGYGEDGAKVKGYAFPVGGAGFWGPIYGMVAVDAGASRILGVAFYKHSETPGLGGRISEPWFEKQFAGLPMFYPVEGDRKIFYLKPEGTGKAPNELDAVTGASGTSRALEAFLNRDLETFLKDLRASLNTEKT